MAFLSKVGNILRQTARKQISADISASRPSIYQAIRCMSSSKLFVGGISYGTDDTSLREAFSKYGEVVEARVIMDRETGRSRGFGFVTYTSSEEASSAIQALDGQDLHGRRVRVNYATDRARPAYGGGGGYGGGSYGDGGNYGGPGGYYGGGSSGGYGSGGNYSGSYGSGNVGYGSGNAYDSGSTGGYSGAGGNFGVAAGGGGGSDDFGSSPVGGGYDGNTGLGYGGGDQLGANESSGLGDAAGGFNQGGDSLDANYRPDDDDADDFVKRG